MSKKRRNDIAKHSAIARDLVVMGEKEKISISVFTKVMSFDASNAEVLFGKEKKPITYEDVMNMASLNEECYFPAIKNTKMFADGKNTGCIIKYKPSYLSAGFKTDNLISAKIACMICRLANKYKLEDISILYGTDFKCIRSWTVNGESLPSDVYNEYMYKLEKLLKANGYAFVA